MRDEEGFLRAIAEARGDLAPRLVYADWLDEHGDPARAEFLRLDAQVPWPLARGVWPTGLPPHLHRLLALELDLDPAWLRRVRRGPPNGPELTPAFWEALGAAGGSLRALRQWLEGLPDDRLRWFYDEYDRAKCYVNPCSFWECQSHMAAGFSEDNGDDFAAWVVMQGPAFYREVRTRPANIREYLAAHLEAERRDRRRRQAGPWRKDDQADYPGLARGDFLASEVYFRRTGEDLTPKPESAAEPGGTPDRGDGK